MSFEDVIETATNTIQPIQDDFFTDGHLDQYARIDHQHPIAPSLKSRLFSANNSRNRNIIQNAQMLIKQRAITSIVPIGGGTNTIADRWITTNNALGVQNMNYVTKAAFGGGNLPVGRPTPPNIQYIQVTTIDAAPAAGDYTVWYQNVEGLNLQHLNYGTPNAQTVTVSFDIFSTQTSVYCLELIVIGATTRGISRLFTAIGGQFTTIVLTYPGDTAQVIPNDNTARFRLHFFLQGGTTYTSGVLAQDWAALVNANRCPGISSNYSLTVNNIIAITNVQMEVATSPTAFEIVNYDEELRTCLRYFERIDTGGLGGASSYGAGFAVAGNLAAIFVPFVPKRANPTIAVPAANTFILQTAAGAVVPLTVVPGAITKWSTNVQCGTAAAALVAGHGLLLGDGAGASFFEVSAEI